MGRGEKKGAGGYSNSYSGPEPKPPYCKMQLNSGWVPSQAWSTGKLCLLPSQLATLTLLHCLPNQSAVPTLLLGSARADLSHAVQQEGTVPKMHGGDVEGGGKRQRLQRAGRRGRDYREWGRETEAVRSCGWGGASGRWGEQKARGLCDSPPSCYLTPPPPTLPSTIFPAVAMGERKI